MIGYTCKYTPVELLTAFGAEPVELNSESPDFDYAQNLTHGNMCSHMKALLEEVHREGIDELILVNCCDSIRRAYDILKPEMKFLFIMDLPHAAGSCAKQRLASEITRLVKEYSAYSHRTFDWEAFCKDFVGYPDLPDEPYIALMGARAPKGLAETLADSVPLPLSDRTCNRNRGMEAPRDGMFTEPVQPDGLPSAEVIEWYAEALLGQIPCMRMNDIVRRKELVNSPYLKGILYHTVKFCDYYSFEYMRMAKETDVPMLKFETDFTTQAAGQLSTRIGGFVESLRLGKETIVTGEGKYVAGIDSGSTTTNVAVLDRNGKIVDSAIVRTGAKAQKGAEKAMEALKIPREEIASIVATGYGRKNIDFADGCITEITCHARGAFHQDPSVRTIIDIGGQDSKVIALDENGNVLTFAMNDKCAAGTGRFLENMAKVLETDLPGISEAGLSWKEDLTISSMCTVFAESEVVSLIADNKQISDIVHGLNKSVASKTIALSRRVHGKSRYMMTGGVARNKGVVQALEAMLGEPLLKPEIPDLCGAVGAALFALDALKGVE